MNGYDTNANISIIINLKNTSKSKSYENVFSYYEEGCFFVIEKGDYFEGKFAIPISSIDDIFISKKKVKNIEKKNDVCM